MSPGIKERPAKSGFVYQTNDGIARDKENDNHLNDAGVSGGNGGPAGEMVTGVGMDDGGHWDEDADDEEGKTMGTPPP